MKKKLHNIAVLSISLLVSIGAVKAQVVIFEQDGATNEMTPASWTITNDMGFSNSSEIIIGSDESGTLAINDPQVYKDVTCEIHLANGDPNTQFPITFNGYNGGTMTHLITYKLNGGMNKMLFTFDENSFTPISLKEMVFANTPSKNIKISYIKITGIPTTTGLGLENTDIFDVTVSPNNLVINTQSEGTLNIYNNVGQLQSIHTISQGENTVIDSTKGVSFLVFINSNNGTVSRKKIMR